VVDLDGAGQPSHDRIDALDRGVDMPVADPCPGLPSAISGCINSRCSASRKGTSATSGGERRRLPPCKANARAMQEIAARVAARVLAGAGIGKGRTGKESAVGKVVRCSCGVELRSQDEGELIRQVQAHARDVHDALLSEEQVRAMMEIDQ